MVEYVWTHPTVIDGLINHLECRPLAEGLVKLISFEGTNNPNIDFVESRIQKVQAIVQLFNNPELASDVANNAAFVLNDIISKTGSLVGGSHFEEYFGSKDFLDLAYTQSKLVDAPACPHLLSVINAAIQAWTQPKSTEEQTPEEAEKNIDEELFYEYLANNIQDFVSILHNEPKNTIQTTYGLTVKPLGLTRLRITEIIGSAIKLNNTLVNDKLAETDVYSTLMELMVKFEWNNILHNIIERIFMSTLEGNVSSLRKNVRSYLFDNIF